MKCPRLTSEYVWPSGGKEVELDECIKQECGLYDPANQCCAPVALNQIMVAIGNTLGELLKEVTK